MKLKLSNDATPPNRMHGVSIALAWYLLLRATESSKMRICKPQFILFILLVLAWTTANGDDSSRHTAIDSCIREYSRLSGKRLDPEADNVFMIHAGDKIELVFHRGELRLPGGPRSSYRAYLSCGVQVSGPMTIYFLSEPMHDPLIYLRNVDWISESYPVADVRESKYVRTDDGFQFLAEQPWDPGEIKRGELESQRLGE